MTATVCDSALLLPVTPTRKVEAVENVQDNAALPDPVTLVGETVHDVLFVTRSTLAEKPFDPVTVMVDWPVVPALTGTLVELAVITKSWKM
jgi:hypothetical protein